MPSLTETSAWGKALETFDDDLRRRAVADKTRDAYASDCRQFGAWAEGREIDPAHVDVRTLRRYAAAQSESGMAPSTIARRLAALRGLFRTQMEIGAREDNPAELLSSPKKPQRLPHVLKAG
ncbi:MAG: site-specific integrase, partial [Solirubrobacteraceae bacterium]